MYTIQFVFSGAEQQTSTSACQDGPSHRHQVEDLSVNHEPCRKHLGFALDSLINVTNDLRNEREASQRIIQSQKEEIARQKKEIEILKLEVEKLSSGQRAGNILGFNSNQT